MRIPKTRGRIAERALRKFKLRGERRKGEIQLVRGACFTSGFNFNKFMHVGWFGFMQEIVGDGNNFELSELFDFQPVKKFE